MKVLSNKNKIVFLALALSLVVIAIVAYMIFSKTNILNQRVLRNGSNQSNFTSQNDGSSKADANEPKVDVTDIKSVLPNGRTATYSNTESNNQILFYGVDPDYKQSGNSLVKISHKLYEGYLSSVDPVIIEKNVWSC